jgi:hypothetical protein
LPSSKAPGYRSRSSPQQAEAAFTAARGALGHSQYEAAFAWGRGLTTGELADFVGVERETLAIHALM